MTVSDEQWEEIKSILSRIKARCGEPPKRVVTGKFTEGMLLGNGDIGVVVGDSWHRQKFYFGKSDFWGASVKNNGPTWQESILNAGQLTVSGLHDESGDSLSGTGIYCMEQDILHAEVRTTMLMNGAIVEMTSWTADIGNYFITEITADKAVAVKVCLSVPTTYQMRDQVLDCQQIYPYSSGVANGALWVTRENYNYRESDHHGGYKARISLALTTIGSPLIEPESGRGYSGALLRLSPSKTVYLIVAFSSGKAIGNANCPSVEVIKDSAIAMLASVDIARIDEMRAHHREWWRDYWSKSYVVLNDSVLEKFYYGSLYILGSASRPGNFPPSLFGPWVTTDTSSWGGRYFLNYNEEAAFYGVCSSNRPELMEPYIELILNEMPWQINKTHAAGYPGLCHQRSLCPYNLVNPRKPEISPIVAQKDHRKLPADQKSNGTFAALPLIWYYEYTHDLEFLRRLYPLLHELDAFYRAFMNRSQKPYVIEHSSAHEGSDDINPNLDIGFCRRICRTLLETSKILGVDEDLQEEWEDILENLAEYPTVVWNGKVVYGEAASKRGSTDPQRLFEPGCQPINMEGSVFPGENIHLGSDPEYLQIAVNSLQEMNSWCVTPGGNSHNGFPKIWPIAARVGWPAEDLMIKLKAAIENMWRPSNLTVFQGGGGIETAGAIEGINSMLLQHEGGILRLFPAWPRTKDVKFCNLRAKGAFLVSSEFKEGSVQYVEIFSEMSSSLRIENPWFEQQALIYRVEDGICQLLECCDSDEIQIDTEANGRYLVIANSLINEH